MSEMRSARGLGETTVTIAGVEYPYLPGGASSFSRAMEEGGFGLNSSASFLIVRSLFETLPKSANLLTDNKDGKRYRIQTVTESSDGSHVAIVCADYAKGM